MVLNEIFAHFTLLDDIHLICPNVLMLVSMFNATTRWWSARSTSASNEPQTSGVKSCILKRWQSSLVESESRDRQNSATREWECTLATHTTPECVVVVKVMAALQVRLWPVARLLAVEHLLEAAVAVVSAPLARRDPPDPQVCLPKILGWKKRKTNLIWSKL